MTVFTPLRFIGEPIDVYFDTPPVYEKKPGLPSGFTLRGEAFAIGKLLSEWHDYRRRGHMARNMRPTHSATASVRGSWGVGQDYFRVRTENGRIFELYYDRAPKSVDDRKGAWFLDRELREQE